MIELCELMLSKGRRRFKWMCFTRTDLVDPELCKIMREAGCYLITFGCESGDQSLLDIIKKKLTVEKNMEGIQIAREAGIRALSSFMLGLPTSTPEKDRKSVSFAIASKLDYAVFPVFEPYPGTEIWQDAEITGTS